MFACELRGDPWQYTVQLHGNPEKMRARAVRVRNCATFSKTCKHICRHMQGADWQYYGYARLVKTRWQEMLRPRIAERCSYCHERLLTDPLVHRFYWLFFFAYCTLHILSVRHLCRLAAMGDVAAVGQETLRITVLCQYFMLDVKAHYVSRVSWITNGYQ